MDLLCTDFMKVDLSNLVKRMSWSWPILSLKCAVAVVMANQQVKTVAEAQGG